MKSTKLNFAGKITRALVNNRPLAILLLIAVTLGGIFAYLQTPKQYNPEITLPAFQVSVEYPGATATEVENLVTRELEEKILDIEGVDQIFARSIDGGMSIVNVEFKIGEDLEDAKIRLQSKINENADLQIGTIREPLIRNINPDAVPILTFGFTSATLSQNEIRYLAIELMNALKAIENVSNLEVVGGQSPALRVILDPGKMQERKVAPEEIVQAIKASNLKFPAGKLEGEDNYLQIEVDGTLKNADIARQILVAPGIRLGDVSEVSLGFSEKVSFTEVATSKQTKEAVFLAIAKTKGANSVILADRVIEKLNQLLAKEKFTELEVNTFRNDGEVAQEAVSGLFQNLTTSIIIVTLVLLVFLGLRPAIVVAIAIPLTLALTFFLGYLLGESINRISLFALILSLGLLVDSATVVTENIHRHIQKGDNKKDSIIAAVNEVGIGLFLSTITSVIVFLPTSRISGMMGEYMGPLSIFVPIALVMSLLVAYKLTPFLADTLLKVEDKKQKNKKGVFEHLANFYGKVLRIILSKKRNQIILLLTTFILLIVVFIFPVLRLVHFRMLPAADRDQFYVYLDAPEGTNYPRTKEIADDVTQLLLAHKETRSVQNFTARAPVLDFNGLYRSANLRSQPFLATLRVNLTPKEARDQTSEQIVQTIRSQIRANQKLVNLWQEGVRIRLVEDPPGPPVQATLQAKIKGPQDEIRSLITEKVVSAFAQTQEVVDIYTTEEASFPRLVYSVNHQKALELGVSTAQIASALNSALSPVKVDQFHLPEQNEFVFIELQFAKDARASILDLEKVQIKNQLGEMLPLSSVVIREDSRNVPVRYRDEQINTNYVNAEMGKRSVVYAVIDLIKELHGQDLSPEIQFKDWNLFALRYEDQNGDQYLIEWGGEWKMTLENFRDLSLAMLVAFVLIYAVLVGQFRSFTAPALIMTTIPLGFLGILPGFAILDALNGTFLTATSLIGFIALMGIVVNNAILYLEYFDQLQSRGLDRKTALIEAGQTRLRPILLTSMTTILGTLTIASDPVWSGLAWSIVFGLSLSVIFTLIVFPTLYNLIKPKR